MSITDLAIIVPIFQAVDDLDRCLTSLERSLPAGTRVHLADDASPDTSLTMPRLTHEWPLWSSASLLARNSQ